jgi:non-heme chloroperoxidase
VTERKQLVKQLLSTNLPLFEKHLWNDLKDLKADQNQPDQASPPSPPASPPASQAVMMGQRKYTDIHAPVLAIYAIPHDNGQQFKDDTAAAAAADARDEAVACAQAKAFQAGIPTARVVRLPHANHFVFQSNEADVLREINTFIKRLH